MFGTGYREKEKRLGRVCNGCETGLLARRSDLISDAEGSPGVYPTGLGYLKLQPANSGSDTNDVGSPAL